MKARTVNPEVAGSSPVEPAINSTMSVTVLADCHRNDPQTVPYRISPTKQPLSAPVLTGEKPQSDQPAVLRATEAHGLAYALLAEAEKLA